jgi:hypothetical protein
LVAHPRQNADKLRELGFDVAGLSAVQSAGGGPQQGAY